METQTLPEGTALDHRTLNRSLLARQFLLRRADVSAEHVVGHLVGLQAQEPQDPYVALWSRIAGFAPDELSGMLADRRAVRMSLLRWTVHLVTAEDCMVLRPVVQDVLERRLLGQFRRQLAGLDLAEVAEAGRALLTAGPLPASRLGDGLRERWPERERLPLSLAVTARVPTVQPPPRGLWRTSGAALQTPAEQWLGRSFDFAEGAAPDRTVLRYLAAFGPATAKDVAVWSGLTGVRAVIERLRPGLRVYRDENGAELYDVPGAPFPDRGTPAPARFLPQYDNIALSHADRSRIMPPAPRAGASLPTLPGSGSNRGFFLHDGFVHGLWRIESSRGAAVLHVLPYAPLPRAARDALAAEGERLLAFAAPGTTGRETGREVRFTA
ncbi:winged helix DNA-binding domain-containing protein [Streptomyces sp. MI02-7b]|uniref:winged helix DNA-binding domain-containing protein n=1 Tax=Streptomyces sp. MI02-7b TaxID=462941 RepID=UPI0029B118A5|nr:winged helix DNA-binding domain-containing protein [Streptomyces sp. MI02-7b]MDX3075017.1 winged helix DNA-binding domain-containing protein [Streptomyces sp. MI02-7b]